MRPTAILALLLAVAGCQRLNDERTVPLGPSQVHAVLYDAPRSDQKVSVTVSSPGAPVDAYLVLEKERQAVQDGLDRGQRPATAKVLAGKEKVEEASLEATVPAKSAFAVLLNSKSNKTADVKVKVTGR
jgi:hypothetical protein